MIKQMRKTEIPYLPEWIGKRSLSVEISGKQHDIAERRNGTMVIQNLILKDTSLKKSKPIIKVILKEIIGTMWHNKRPKKRT
jgi:hypothetical protein